MEDAEIAVCRPHWQLRSRGNNKASVYLDDKVTANF
jgi:hypothetical protein